MSREEFKFFRKHVIQQQEAGWTNPYSEKMLIATPKTGVHMILSPAEFNQLQQMLEAADVEAEALQLLQLFNQ